MISDANYSPISEKEKAAIEGFCNRISNLQGATLKVEDIAEASLYLASNGAKHVSGHNIVVDGGITFFNHSWRSTDHRSLFYSQGQGGV